MSKQQDVNSKMREILVDWLHEVHLKFRLQTETMFLAINYLDRFLERRAVNRTKLQLVGCAAMLLAAKYEEMYPPEIRHFVYISDKAYTKDQILSMEQIMLSTIEFNLTAPTALRFAERFMKIARITDTNKWLCQFLIELTLQDISFLSYTPSMIASGAVWLVLNHMGSSWSSTLSTHTGYSEEEVKKTAAAIYNYSILDNPKYVACRKKYNQSKFNAAASIKLNKPIGF
jgi:hypothetical protein